MNCDLPCVCVVINVYAKLRGFFGKPVKNMQSKCANSFQRDLFSVSLTHYAAVKCIYQLGKILLYQCCIVDINIGSIVSHNSVA